MHIAFFCQYYPPESNAPASRTHEHARHWVRKGHEVTVLCALPNHPHGKVPAAYRGHLLFREVREGVKVMRVWLYATPNAGRVLRSFSFLTFMFSAFVAGLTRLPQADVIIGTSPQLLCAFSACLVARLRRVPFVLEVRDLWPQQIVDLGVIKNPILIRFLERLEFWLYLHARKIVVVAEAMKTKLIERGVPAEKIAVIPNGVDPDFFKPTDEGGIVRRQMDWEGRFVAMYIGTMGLSQGLDTVLDAAALLAEKDPEIVVGLVGDGADRERLLAESQRRNLSNVVFFPNQAKDRMPAMYAASDCCIAPLKKLDVFRHTIPSKIFEVMSCAKPLILSAEGQSQTIVENSGAGLVTEPENAEALAGAIMRLKHEPELAAQLGKLGRAYVEIHFNRAENAQKYIDLLENSAT